MNFTVGIFFKDDMAEAQKRREQQKKLEDAKKIAAQKGPMSKWVWVFFQISTYLNKIFFVKN